MAHHWLLALALVCAVAAQHPDNCRNWCQDEYGRYTCCENLSSTTQSPVDIICRITPWLCNNQRKCPEDNRPKWQCTQSFASAAGGVVSGPEECYSNSECGSRALCCWDSCLGYRKCTNV